MMNHTRQHYTEQLCTSDYKGKEAKRELLNELFDTIDQLNKWRLAVIDACIVRYLDWDEENPKQNIDKIVDIDVMIALDPGVSSSAQELIERGKAIANTEQAGL